MAVAERLLKFLGIEPRVIRVKEPVITMAMKVYREKTGKWEDGPPVTVSTRAPVEVSVRSRPQ